MNLFFKQCAVVASGGLLALGLCVTTPSVAVAEDGQTAREKSDKGFLGGPERESDKKAKGDKAGRGRPMMHLMKSLELTDAQKEQIRPIMKAHGEKVKAYREANKEQHRELMQQLKQAKENKDRDAAQAVVAKLKELHANRPGPDAMFAQVRDVLTAEQQKKFDTALAEMKKRMEQRREKMKEGKGKPKDKAKGKDKDKDKPGDE